MLFGVCLGPCYEKAKAVLLRIEPLVDGVEIRLDTFSTLDLRLLQGLLSCFKKKVIFTYRKYLQEESLLDLWQKLMELRPDYIDLDCSTALRVRDAVLSNPYGIQLILSCHDFFSSDRIDSIFEEITQQPAHIYKIAAFAKSSLDSMNMLKLNFKAKQKGISFIGLCMGELGQVTRILAPVFGGFLSYASFQGQASAPGQLDILSMNEEYNFSRLSEKTSVFALIGDPVDHSIGPLIHNELFRKKNEDAVYVKMALKKGELFSFFSLFRELIPFKGLSITMPLKESSLNFVDKCSKTAKACGAINTVVKKGDVLFGDNTDSLGALVAIEAKTSIKNHKILVIGTGGAARAVVYALKSRGADVTVMGRTKESLDSMQRQLGCPFTFFDSPDPDPFSFVINTLPQEVAVDQRWLSGASVIMDISYNLRSETIYDLVKENKVTSIYGLDMFLNQLFMQRSLWKNSSDITTS